MHTDSGLAHIILDFDGTCTQIAPIFEAYLDLYRKGPCSRCRRRDMTATRRGSSSFELERTWQLPELP
jgi:hypothetical protein